MILLITPPTNQHNLGSDVRVEGSGQGGGLLTAVLVGLGHLGELLQLLGTVLPVALTFPLLTGLQPFLDNVDDFLIDFTERKKWFTRNPFLMVCCLSGPSTLKTWANPRRDSQQLTTIPWYPWGMRAQQEMLTEQGSVFPN